MYTFILSLVILILGYIFYGKFVEKVVDADNSRTTPAFTKKDGVDFIPMPSWKVFLIQFLNIAGTGPIFGAILGILYGPAAYLWIVFGSVFGGAVHDYTAGMISLRKNGASLPEIVGDELGKGARISMRALSLLLMILVGAVFTSTPAGLLSSLTSDWGVCGSVTFWTIIILAYYLLATLLPISKLIGRIYPIFGFALLVMGVGVLIGIFTHPGYLPEITEAFSNHHPNTAMPLYPGICITIACGAVSGFHATQSPLMARCLKKEKTGRPIFYGAMIAEGIIALIWAVASIRFVSSLGTEGNTPYEQLLNFLTDNGQHSANPALLVNALCHSWIGSFGAILAILGVVFAPISTGDTAMRSGRLIAADILKIRQDKLLPRILITLPIFACSIIVMLIDFQVLWRYFAWFNQSLSIFTFWAIAIWLAKNEKQYIIAVVPAMWMSMVCMTYILVAPEGFSLPSSVSNIVGILFAVVLLGIFINGKRIIKKKYTK